MAEDKVSKPPDRSRRAVILATVEIVVIMGLAVFYVAVVAPIRRTHHALRVGGEYDEFHSDQPIQELGGPEEAAKRLIDYLRLPNWIASRKAVAAYELGLCGEWGVPCLIDCLSDSDAGVRTAAAHGLSLVEPPPQRAVAPLICLVRDSDAHARAQAASALAHLAYMGLDVRDALTVLVEALSDEDRFVRQLAADALGNIRAAPEACVPALRKLTTDPERDVRRSAAEALNKIRGSEEGEE